MALIGVVDAVLPDQVVGCGTWVLAWPGQGPRMSEQMVAHYRLTGKLGAGGMHEVYRATDTKLGREVAVKVLPGALAPRIGSVGCPT